MAAAHRVSIVILNWQRSSATLHCLVSLRAVEGLTLDIVVVDNGSCDGSTDVIRSRFPHVTVIENRRNLGFAGGCNVGIRWAFDHGADFVVLLNDDATVAPDTFQKLIRVADGDQRIGMLGPTIYYGRRRDVIWSAGGDIDTLGRPRHLLDGTTLPRSLLQPRDVGYVTGCVLMVSRAVVEAVGLLDERFFAYFEEAEWCARARRSGYRVVHVPDASAWHDIEPNERGMSPLYLYLMARNRLLYLRCSQVTLVVLLAAIADVLRTSLSWSYRPRYRAARPFASVLRRAVCDFAAGRFGAPPADLRPAPGS
ncbi:MAG: glycosyltransferase family 2 protein [Chloroflexi bacterium]|nr:glycosyltransferase family 2 protein [Chloroflexota bacterium]